MPGGMAICCEGRLESSSRAVRHADRKTRYGNLIFASKISEKTIGGIHHKTELVPRTAAGVKQQKSGVGGVDGFKVLNVLEHAVLIDEKVVSGERFDGIALRIVDSDIEGGCVADPFSVNPDCCAIRDPHSKISAIPENLSLADLFIVPPGAHPAQTQSNDQ
jgi:hypothetical protein